MMDPFTITATCVGLVSAITQLTSQIKTFVGEFRDARKDLESVTAELQSLSLCLECLQSDYSNARISYPDSISKSLLGVLQNCDNVTTQMQTLLDQTSSLSMQKRLQWAMHGRQQMNALRSSLEAHKSAIDIALEMTTAVVVSSVAQITTTIEQDTKDIKKDTSKIESVLEEIQTLRIQLQRNEQTGNETFLLDRFLSESCSYAQSACNLTGDDRFESFSSLGGPDDTTLAGGQPFSGELREIYSISSGGHLGKIPQAEERILLASQARDVLSRSERFHLDNELSVALLEDDQETKEHLARLERLLDIGANANLRMEINLPQIRLHAHRHQPVSVTALAAEICKNKSVTAIILLLSRGADISHPSVLPIAAKVGDYQILELLLKHGADPNRLAPEYWPSSYHGNALTILCRDYLNEANLRLLLEKGADPNQASYFGETALFTAVFFDFHGYADILLNHGASVFLRGGYFGTVLETAAAGPNYSLRCIGELLRRGCDVNETGGHFGTALSAAAAQGHVKGVKRLLDAGADPDERGYSGKRPIDWLGESHRINPRRATKVELEEIRQLLWDASARWNVHGHRNPKPYHIRASSSGQE